MNSDRTVYSVIVPLYNEEAVVQDSYKRIREVMDTTGESYEIIFINDGSKDSTYQKVREILKKDKNVKLISFSRNFGHQSAITAGMDYCTGQAVIVIDADLQDPPEVMLKMIEKWKEGYEVVYGKRIKRKGETLFKKATAKIFYRILSKTTDVEIPIDTGDFRLIDRKVCDALKAMPERNRYVRGLISWLGFRQTGVEFVREKRLAGETKYSMKKMFKLAWDGITAFSNAPLKLATYIGVSISAVSFLYLLVVICQKLFTDTTVQGWASLVAISLFFNGVILIVLGIIGEYIRRIYDEAKGRPIYIISEKIGFDEGHDE
ncbi:MAG TPA: glycosyltransferase family 2 protein [Clostridiales bacterium]|nr:glycosyltransferase family 2 protein [Clostridiales bacterium]